MTVIVNFLNICQWTIIVRFLFVFPTGYNRNIFIFFNILKGLKTLISWIFKYLKGFLSYIYFYIFPIVLNIFQGNYYSGVFKIQFKILFVDF